MATFNNPFEMFGTDKALETRGITVDYGAFWFKVTRIDVPESQFAQAIKQAMAPYRRAIDLGEMDPKIAERITAEVFAKTAVLAWGCKQPDPEDATKVVDVEGKMPGADGQLLDFSVENVLSVLKALPKLFEDLIIQAKEFKNFRKLALEEEAGN